MNTYLIIVNILGGLAFGVHTFMGDRELHLITPASNDSHWLKKQETWTMTRCGWHWISFDLLMLTVLLSLINFTNWIPHPAFVVQLLAIYTLGYALFWLVTVAISRSFAQNYLKLGQWMLMLLISGLLFLGV
ncbi:hypothetical protein [Microscilla marina]|uniref:Integral membrane protein n=1 Tax=Microscilla marina ATCC 23134 TaxID=313606 RepID=A1ZDC7_MICM2|nr:hypothetical protein [Microscilla marina]EAY31666.1 hypothetical protein M23134_05172 [Microscilla marina ATCC 23134]